MCVSVSTFSPMLFAKLHFIPLRAARGCGRLLFFCCSFPHAKSPNSFQTLATTLPTNQTVILRLPVSLKKPPFAVSLWINLIRETETVKRTHKCHQTQAAKSGDLGQFVQTCAPVTQLYCPARVTTLHRTCYLRPPLKGHTKLLRRKFFSFFAHAFRRGVRKLRTTA